MKQYQNPETLTELYHVKGLTQKAIGERFDVSTRTVRHWMNKHKIKTGYNYTSKKGQSKYDVNSDYFKNIDTNESAYWLGFIYGDGCIRTIQTGTPQLQIRLKNEDKDHLRKFKRAVDSAHKISDISDGCVNIGITDKVFCEGLIEHGADSNKTHSGSLPNLSADLHPHFVRGLFDADGHHNDRVWLITGQKNRLESLRSWLPVPASIYQQTNAYNLSVVKDRHKVLDWLYPEQEQTTPALSRKIPDFN